MNSRIIGDLDIKSTKGGRFRRLFRSQRMMVLKLSLTTFVPGTWMTRGIIKNITKNVSNSPCRLTMFYKVNEVQEVNHQM